MTTHDLFDDAFDHTPPEPPAKPVASRRDRRHRRTVRRRVIVGVLTAFLVLAALLIVTDSVRLGSGDRPLLAAENSSRSPDPKVPTSSEVSTRTLSATTPLRLWIAGDSLAYSLGQSLGNLTATTGIVKPVYDARVSSGLSSPQFFDWPDHGRSEDARLDPEAIVYIIGANDLGVVSGKDWESTYGAKVDEMMDILAGPNDARAVYWIGPPTFKDKKQNDASKKMNALMKERATKHKSVTFIDGYDVFADGGKYAAKLKNNDGELVLVRTDDGVHFTAAGGERLAQVVFAAMDRSWRLQAQAVPGAIQTIEQTAGCCTTPSGSNNTQWQTGPTPTRPRSASPSTTAGTTATTTAKAPSPTVAAPTTPSSQPTPSSPTTPTTPGPQPAPDTSSGE